ncbi:MAG: hypothetical protein GWN53_17265 [Gammaproteobacteria bacterium]|uniref:Uncharacterized protein n=1 Tax=Candidatus Kutchimonas denitrificans TaxID=3056748 RepID=A0AAE4ZAS8_9BACT|nr:hypothetical protein [Candidatus Kutchimonas denitrificans]NIV53592.1 hypothetical protein [Gammaproteobacteria bacterium]
MPKLDPRNMNPTELVEATKSAKAFLRALEQSRSDARDEELVWIEQPNGRKEVCRYGLWRKHLSRQQERGFRLLDPDEVADEQAKVAQAAAARKERRKLWMKIPKGERGEFEARKPREKYSLGELRQILEENGWQNRDQFDDFSLAQLQAKVIELQNQIEEQKKPPPAAA